MSKTKRIIPVLAILALGACTDLAGPTDPVATAATEGVQQQDPAGESRGQAPSGDALGN